MLRGASDALTDFNRLDLLRKASGVSRHIFFSKLACAHLGLGHDHSLVLVIDGPDIGPGRLVLRGMEGESIRLEARPALLGQRIVIRRKNRALSALRIVMIHA